MGRTKLMVVTNQVAENIWTYGRGTDKAVEIT
jgi:hypothetical protein